MSLTNKVAQFDADSNLVNAWVHGPASGVGSTITTDSGTVRTPAKLIADKEDEINVGAVSVLALATAQAGIATTKANEATEQVTLATAQKTAAVNAKVSAELSAANALISSGTYETEVLGRAAVADGVAFKVQGSGDVAAYEYRRTNSTTSVLIALYPSASVVTTPEKTNFLTTGKNKFNKAAILAGHYCTEIGVILANEAYDTSDYIPVIPGTSYFSASTMRYVCFFDTNKVAILGGNSAPSNSFTAPAGAAFVRVTLVTSDRNVLQVEVGTAATVYESFVYKLASPAGSPLLAGQLVLMDGSVTNSKLALSSVTPEKTNFLICGKNKFNANSVTAGSYLSDTNIAVVNAGYSYSDFIPVIAGQDYVSNTPMRFTCYFNAAKEVVTGGYGGGTTISSFTVPVGVSYVRVTIPSTIYASFQLETGSVATTFEAFYYKLQPADGGYVLIDQLAPQSITPKETNFLVIGKNKFNKATITTGFYLGETGVAAANASYSYSDFIAVAPSQAYVGSSGMRFTTYYNAAKSVIAGGAGSDGFQVTTFTTPATAAFVRVTIGSTAHDGFQLETGSVSTAFEAFGYRLTVFDGIPVVVQASQVEVSADVVTIAAKQYIAYGKEIALYHENVIKDYMPHRGRTGISFTGGQETGPATKITPTIGQANTTIGANASIVNADYIAFADKAFSVVVSDAAKTTAANILNIGDSFTGRMTWANVILGTPAATGLTFSGNRNSNSSTIRCEGQGGWTMASYFTVDYNGYLSPFMQPGSFEYKYFGQTSFWIDANSVSPSYNAASFDGIKGQFSASTGRKIAPSTGDLMGEAGGYIYWNGVAWVSIASGDFGGFAFNYGRYLAAWGIAAPTIVHVLLGTNDFYSATDATFAATYALYKTRYNTLIASVKADTPGAKIVVGIPVSSGRQGKWGTLTTERVKRAMWLLAKSLNADYGGREAEGIYVLDYHSVVDRFYGFDQVYDKPFTDYSGATGDGLYKSDITHLSLDGFKQMGNAYMGLIQYLR